MPNQEQIKSIIQLLLGAGGPLAALLISYGVPADKLSLWTNLAVAVLPPLAAGIWAILDKTHKNQIAAVQSIPGVDIKVDTKVAPAGAVAAAADPSLPNVDKA